jgi:hypothetical protein
MTNILALLLSLILVASMWRIFGKAGQRGWQSIVPVYNIFVTFRIADLPMWQAAALLMMLVARAVIRNTIGFSGGFVIVSFALLAASAGLFFMASMGLASKFGKGTGFAVGMTVVPFVFYPILAFGSASYGEPQPRETLGLSGV